MSAAETQRLAVTLTVAELLAGVADVVSQKIAEVAREPLPALLTSEQISRELGVSVVHLRKLVNDGKIPFVAVGDCKRYELAAVLAALRGAP